MNKMNDFYVCDAICYLDKNRYIPQFILSTPDKKYVIFTSVDGMPEIIKYCVENKIHIIKFE